MALKERNKLKRESAANFDQVGSGDADKLLQQKDDEVRKWLAVGYFKLS